MFADSTDNVYVDESCCVCKTKDKVIKIESMLSPTLIICEKCLEIIDDDIASHEE